MQLHAPSPIQSDPCTLSSCNIAPTHRYSSLSHRSPAGAKHNKLFMIPQPTRLLLHALFGPAAAPSRQTRTDACCVCDSQHLIDAEEREISPSARVLLMGSLQLRRQRGKTTRGQGCFYVNLFCLSFGIKVYDIWHASIRNYHILFQ